MAKMREVGQRELERRHEKWARDLAAATTETPTEPEGVTLLDPRELLDRIWNR